jgi:hypothetical protein
VLHVPEPLPFINGPILKDNLSTLFELLTTLNAAIVREGVSPLPLSVLSGRDPAEILRAGARLVLPGRRNLSAAGAIEQVSDQPPPALARLAVTAVLALGLDIGAVDMFDLSTARDFSDPVVIEVNGNPGLRTLELAGRTDLIRAIWVSMLNACLGS